MSFQATLTVEGKSFNVLQCAHQLVQKSNNGKPASGVRGGIIYVIIEGTDEDLLGDWATGPTTKKNGDITFDRIDQQSTLSKLEFEEAYATLYFEFMASNSISADAILVTLDEMADWDLTNEDDFMKRVIAYTKTLVKFVERTRVSNCILLRLSASKIKLDGVEHKNT